jgi:4'-phosphopantetheinyl transferase
LLTEDERKAVLRYLFVRDAKMSLASHLLKHYVVSRFCDVPWWATKITRNAKTKPVYVDPATGKSPVEFNVTHQAGLVAMVASYGYEGVDVGVDIVCVSERRDRDHAAIGREGWPSFVDMHADVFAPSEANYLKYQVPGAHAGAGATAAQVTDLKLRCFYTLWCLREAYVKMTGEALLAPWLKVLEFRNFRPPQPTASFDEQKGDGSDVVKEHDIWFEGSKVEDANVCLRSLGPDYMTCTAVRTSEQKEVGLGLDLGPFEVLRIDDILDFAESRT